jgi:hypothetical protein
MGRHWRRGALAVVLAGSLVVPVTSGVAAATQASAVPAKIVGGWNRNVTQVNYKKYGQGQQGFLTGVWTMVVKKSGGVDFYTPGGYRPGCIATHTCVYDFSTSFAVTGARLSAGAIPGCTTKGTYNWKVLGRSLTLKVLADKQCGPREALFSGVWKRTRL